MGNKQSKDHSKFFEYCKEGNFEKVKDFLTSYKSAVNAKASVSSILSPLSILISSHISVIYRSI